MNIYMVCAIVLLILALAVVTFNQRQGRKVSEEIPAAPADSAFQCCGKHAVCEKEKLAEAMMKAANYFEDEHLDMYSGRSATEYTDSEIEEFRYVLYTMQPAEVPDWLDSLQVRHIELPVLIREEAIGIINC